MQYILELHGFFFPPGIHITSNNTTGRTIISEPIDLSYTWSSGPYARQGHYQKGTSMILYLLIKHHIFGIRGTFVGKMQSYFIIIGGGGLGDGNHTVFLYSCTHI